MNTRPAIVGDSTPIPSLEDPHLTPAPLTTVECGQGSVTYNGIPIAVVAPTPLIHVVPPVNPPAFPSTGSLAVTAYGLPMHRLGDVRVSGEQTVIVDWQLPDSYGDISRKDVFIGG
jgi:uncharacterized Zn-binding protein involved in type VI secretion